MRLPSADFESAASASNLCYISKIIISLWKMCNKVCKFRPAFCKTRLQPDRSILADLCIELEGGRWWPRSESNRHEVALGRF